MSVPLAGRNHQKIYMKEGKKKKKATETSREGLFVCFLTTI